MSFHHSAERFRDSDDERRLVRPLESTEPTQAMIDALLKHVQNQFYTTYPVKRWLQEQKHILMIITWPATWLNQRGISLPLNRYERLLRDIIVEIQHHGDTASVKFFPAYFERVVKQWFIHNGEGLYEERKLLRNALDMRFLKGLNPTPPKEPDPIEALAMANRVLASNRRKSKPAAIDESQPSLFDL